jgi:uncharacterized repeat protein (TIGR01451 family)
MARAGALFLAFGTAFGASGQATSSGLRVKVVAEVESRTVEAGQETVKLAPADRLVPGDKLIYSLEIRNSSPVAIPVPVVVNPVPAHTAYLADSAAGPAADVSYSVDGGQVFDRPENLRVTDAQGHPVRAAAQDYTHIRWQLKHALKSKSTAYARFRAIVK